MTTRRQTRGAGLVTIAIVVLATLKFSRAVSWSWWYVLVPAIVPMALVALFAGCLLVSEAAFGLLGRLTRALKKRG